MKNIFGFLNFKSKKTSERLYEISKTIAQIDKNFKYLLMNHCEYQNHNIINYCIHNINIYTKINDNDSDIVIYVIEVFTSRPGIIIGKEGRNIKLITNDVVLITKEIVEDKFKKSILLEFKLTAYDPLKINYNED